MSPFDQFWSFKLVLEERLGSRDTDQIETSEDRGPAITAPFVEVTTSPPMAASLKDVEQYYLTDEKVEPAVAAVAAVAAKIDSLPKPPVKKPKPFVLPSAAELDRLTVGELRQLRRRLALEVHPDRIGSRTVAGQSNIMGRCNRLIDDAISRKGL